MSEQDKTTEAKIEEMEQRHRERTCALLFETGRAPSNVNQDTFIAAYHAVLTRDVLWALTELLAYKQNEVHR